MSYRMSNSPTRCAPCKQRSSKWIFLVLWVAFAMGIYKTSWVRRLKPKGFPSQRTKKVSFQLPAELQRFKHIQPFQLHRVLSGPSTSCMYHWATQCLSKARAWPLQLQSANAGGMLSKRPGLHCLLALTKACLHLPCQRGTSRKTHWLITHVHGQAHQQTLRKPRQHLRDSSARLAGVVLASNGTENANMPEIRREPLTSLNGLFGGDFSVSLL